MNWFIVKFKTFLAKYTLVIEFCDECGKKQSLVWHANDNLYFKITGKKENGVYCPKCFDKKALQKGILLNWEPKIWEKNGN